MRLSRLFALLLGMLIALPLFAAEIPPTLEPWKDWVLKDQSWRNCPLMSGRSGADWNDYTCIWPGRLQIDAQADGASLSMTIRVDAAGWVPLPGDSQHWPQQATLDGRAVEVVDFAGPALRLEPGSYAFRARIPWAQRPQSLRVPSLIGLVSLAVDGKPVTPLQRDGEQITLGRAAGTAPEADSMELRVFRLLDDGLPAQLTTQIELYVSGQAREEILGPVLPAGFLPMALDGDGWAARLEPDGRLRVQVQPGDQTLTLTARAIAPLVSASVPTIAEPWPAQEIWSYQGAPAQRVTAATAAITVDPDQAGVPDEWQSLPAFGLKAGETLTVEERSRGAADAANRLSLNREAWLDFDGGGWFARDQISGSMQRDWRLDVAAPYQLQRADNVLDTDRPGLLITQGAAAQLSGVEWRTPNVGLAASVRIEPASRQLPISGWQQTFDRIDTTLHLPNGYRLIAAPGSDRADGSWLERWSLLDVFVAAMTVLLAWRLLGIGGGALALLYLVLGYQEAGAPLALLIAAILLALLARAVPAGRLARATLALRYVALGLLLLAALPFALGQVRMALYPQLEQPPLGFDHMSPGWTESWMAAPEPAVVAEAPMEMPAPAAPPPPPPMVVTEEVRAGQYRHRASKSDSSDKLDHVVVTGSRILTKDLLGSYDQSTVLQTGSGEASWTVGSVANLSWSGPILADQTVNLWIAPPWLVRSLRIVLVIALGGLLLGLARRLSWRRSDFSATPVTAAPALLLVLGLVGNLPLVPVAQAQETPSESLLAELKARLIRAPLCAPQCASTAQATVSARGDDISVVLDVHALDRVGVPLPLPSAQSAATLLGVRVDGVTVDAFVVIGPSTLLTLTRGVHRVELLFRAGERFDLAFSQQRPHRVVFNGDSWQASGIGEDQLLGDTLSLARVRANESGELAVSNQQFAPFVRVQRSISLALDWEIHTKVERLAPSSGGFTVGVPVIANEHVSTPGIKVAEGRINAAIGNEESVTSWNSTLDKGDTLTLTAPPLADRAEVWNVVVIPTWHVSFSGVPESNAVAADGNDYRRFQFHPLPGETLTITVTRPAAVAGANRAIDRVKLDTAVGQRAVTQTLDFTLRASQGGEQAIGIPADAELISLSRDGQALNLRPRDGKISLPLQPGSQNYQLVLREPQPITTRTKTPAFDLGLPLANIDLQLTLPDDRWLLAAWGPGVGPAVLFWGELMAMIVLALLLSRWRGSPLRWTTALLLGLGFSTYAWFPLLIVVVWLVAIEWRQRHGAALHDSAFKLAQIALAGLTFVAMLALLAGIRNGLLGTPDMMVSGSQSYGNVLHWFADRSAQTLPQATVISLPIWVYRAVMLLWALWLAWAVTGWLRKAFAAWSAGGVWRATAPAVLPAEADAVAAASDDAASRRIDPII